MGREGCPSKDDVQDELCNLKKDEGEKASTEDKLNNSYVVYVNADLIKDISENRGFIEIPREPRRQRREEKPVESFEQGKDSHLKSFQDIEKSCTCHYLSSEENLHQEREEDEGEKDAHNTAEAPARGYFKAEEAVKGSRYVRREALANRNV